VVCSKQPGVGFPVPDPRFGFTLAEYTDALMALLEELDPGVVSPLAPAFRRINSYVAFLGVKSRA
jgi:hypothetical protein